MEPEIRADLPASSPIVAYGETRHPGGKKFLAILAGSFVLVLIGLVAWVTLGWKISFPKNVILVAAVNGNTELPMGMPEVWQNATHVRHPVLLGLVETGSSTVPFTLGLSSDGSAGTNYASLWPFVLSSNSPLRLDGTLTVRDLLLTLSHLGHHEAYLTLDTRQLFGGNQLISGPLDGTTWQTDATFATTDSHQLPPGDISINLDALPDAWPSIRDALQQSLPTLALDERPAAISWSASGSSTNVVAQFDETPSTSTLLAFASTAGIYDATAFDLPDGTGAEELEPPLQLLNTSGTQSFTSTSGTALSFDNDTIRLGDVSMTEGEQPTCTSAPALFSIDQAAFDALLTDWSLPSLSGFSQIVATINHGKLTITACPQN
ncbi:MAG: hypothetical protein WA001_05950 [Patescibacteria group bacterium]